MRIICLILLISIPFMGCRKESLTCENKLIGTAPAKKWIKTAQGDGEGAHAHYILTCSDGGFLQVGETGKLPQNAQIFVVKTSATGQVEWQQQLANTGNNFGNSVLELDDSYWIIGAIEQDAAIIKLNKTDGTEIERKVYDNGGADAFEHLVQIGNQFIAVGYVNAEDPQNSFFTEGQGYLTFLDSAGNKVSGKNINSIMAHAYRILKYNNALFVSGLTEGAQDYALLKMDATGAVIWQKNYGGSNSDHCFAMDIGGDGSIFLSGHTLSGTDNWDSYTLKINQQGNTVWEAKRGNPRGFDPKYIHDEVWDIKATPDGGCIIVAGTGDEYGSYSAECEDSGQDSNQWQVYLVKFSASGAIDWDKTYGPDGGGDWAGEAIDLTADGGAIIAVDNGQFGFLKIDSF